MAKDVLYINDGVAVNVAWNNHIVISADGVNWDAISKTGLTAGKHFLNLSNSSNSFPERNKQEGWSIVLKRSDSNGAVLKFNPENVTNQDAWSTSGTATDINDGAKTALADILTWLG